MFRTQLDSLKYLSLLCFCLVVFCCNGQTKVIYRADNRILICDVPSRQITIVDTTLWANEKLVNVMVQNDSLICLYSKNEEIFNKKYEITKLKPLEKRGDKKFDHRINPESYYFHNFYFKDYRLILFSNNGISLLEKDRLLWDGSPDYKFNKSLDRKAQPSAETGFKFPVLSPDESHFLVTGYRYNFFNSWAKLYEVNMSNGEMRLLEKNAHNPSYSPSGQYIMFSRYPHGQYYIIDRITRKKLFDYGFEDAFWLAN